MIQMIHEQMLRLDQQQMNIKSGESEEWRSAIYSFKWRHSNSCMIHISEIYEINLTSAQMASWTHFDINTTQFFRHRRFHYLPILYWHCVCLLHEGFCDFRMQIFALFLQDQGSIQYLPIKGEE
ncbi:hypothetical protein LOD99_2107 [Oopsacas minuta]|uniref:Uncharacterized protein n=1 Tax=Oopsacas minuta TaxID=111878 RepID=A0AAV7K574_9METZ|nr:hypothetical protein LOD99_2107 [Oopsacas minuta]